jgi:hypothetical protein
MPTTGAFDQPIFVTSSSLYPIGQKAKAGTFYEDMGIRFNVTYRTGYTYGEIKNRTETIPTMITNLKSHICNITGGSVSYKVHLSSQTISLASNRSEDQFLKAQ